MKIHLRLLATALVVNATAAAQGSVFNPRDDHFVFLGLLRARAEYVRASAELGRIASLADRGFASKSERQAREADYERARVDYMQQALAAVSATAHITVVRAIRTPTTDGGTSVSVVLQHVGGSSDELAKLRGTLDSALSAELRPDVIENVYVSLKNEPGIQGAAIGIPYEHHIAGVARGQNISISFRLLRKTDDVTVMLTYAGRTDERKVVLEDLAGPSTVAIQPTQFSQETELGGEAVFDLHLTRFAGSGRNNFSIVVESLPPEIIYEVRDPVSRARVGRIRFGDTERERAVQFIVQLPRRETAAIHAGKSLRFGIALVEEDSQSARNGARSARVGATHLEIVPRGVPKVDLRAANLFLESALGDSLNVTFSVENSGSRNVAGLNVVAEVPEGWRYSAEPAGQLALAAGDRANIRLRLLPAPNTPDGDYEARVRLETTGSTKAVESDEQVVRMRLTQRRGGLWMIAGVLTTLLIVSGVVWMTVRLARR